MKYITFLQVGDVTKPIEEATPEEMKVLEDKVKMLFKRHVGFVFDVKDKN